MDVEVTNVEGVVIARIVGDIDSTTASQAQERILPLAEAGNRVLLDMSQVGYMSSAGLRMLLSLYRQVTMQDGQVALVGVSEDIQDTMSVTGFLQFFTLWDTVGDGVAALAT
jgi:anti-sigma B factor antagonist